MLRPFPRRLISNNVGSCYFQLERSSTTNNVASVCTWPNYKASSLKHLHGRQSAPLNKGNADSENEIAWEATEGYVLSGFIDAIYS